MQRGVCNNRIKVYRKSSVDASRNKGSYFASFVRSTFLKVYSSDKRKCFLSCLRVLRVYLTWHTYFNTFCARGTLTSLPSSIVHFSGSFAIKIQKKGNVGRKERNVPDTKIQRTNKSQDVDVLRKNAICVTALLVFRCNLKLHKCEASIAHCRSFIVQTIHHSLISVEQLEGQ